MSSQHNSSQALPTDRSLAMQIAEASRYEQSGYVVPPKPKKHASKDASDSASVASKSSFASTIGLLKSKVHSKSSSKDADKKRREELQKIMRTQVNMA